MAEVSHTFQVVADISSDNPEAIEPIVRRLFGDQVTSLPDGFHVEATMTGTTARDLNRVVLSELRRVEHRTRIRSEWTAGGTTFRFFDYVPKGTRPAT